MLDRGADSRQADCCAIDARIADHFNERLAELAVDGKPPDMASVSEGLLRLLGDVERVAPTVLELGCGSGALTVELLRRGAASADAVDLSPDSIDAAGHRAADAGVSERVSFALGDASLVELAAHDWVMLDRVMCCYPNLDRLLANATRAATQRVAFTVPTSPGWRGLINQIGWRIENLPVYLGRGGCMGYVHSNDIIEATLSAAGFAKRRSSRLGLWYAAVWDRPAGLSPPPAAAESPAPARASAAIGTSAPAESSAPVAPSAAPRAPGT